MFEKLLTLFLTYELLKRLQKPVPCRYKLSSKECTSNEQAHMRVSYYFGPKGLPTFNQAVVVEWSRALIL